MKTEHIVRIIVGFVIVTSLALYHWHNPNWIWVTAFVGFALFQSGFTGFCPTEIIVRKLRGESANGARSAGRA